MKVEDFISEYIYKIIQLKFGRDLNQPYGGRGMIELWKEKKSIQFLFYPTEIFHKLKCGR
jgi:hypothetical protein